VLEKREAVPQFRYFPALISAIGLARHRPGYPIWPVIGDLFCGGVMALRAFAAAVLPGMAAPICPLQETFENDGI